MKNWNRQKNLEWNNIKIKQALGKRTKNFKNKNNEEKLFIKNFFK